MPSHQCPLCSCPTRAGTDCECDGCVATRLGRWPCERCLLQLPGVTVPGPATWDLAVTHALATHLARLPAGAWPAALAAMRLGGLPPGLVVVPDPHPDSNSNVRYR